MNTKVKIKKTKDDPPIIITTDTLLNDVALLEQIVKAEREKFALAVLGEKQVLKNIHIN